MTHSFFGDELLSIRTGMLEHNERKVRAQMEAVGARCATFVARVKADATDLLENYPWSVATDLIDVLIGYLLDIERDASAALEGFRAECTPYQADICFDADDFIVDLATSLRDARWDLMAARAERRPAEEVSKPMTAAEFAAALPQPE